MGNLPLLYLYKSGEFRFINMSSGLDKGLQMLEVQLGLCKQ